MFEDYKSSQLVNIDGRELDVVIPLSGASCLNSFTRENPSKRMVVAQLSRARSDGMNA